MECFLWSYLHIVACSIFPCIISNMMPSKKSFFKKATKKYLVAVMVSMALKSWNRHIFFTFWFGKWSASRNYLKFSQIRKEWAITTAYFLWHFFFTLFEISKACVRIMMQRYNFINLIVVNFSCYRRWLHLLFIILFQKR